MPAMRVTLNMQPFAAGGVGAIMYGTTSLPEIIREPIQITGAILHMKYVRVYNQYCYLTLNCGTTIGETAMIPTSSGDAVTRDVYTTFSVSGNILAVDNQTIAFTVQTTNPSHSGNYIGIYQRDEFWMDITYELSVTACTPPTTVSMSPSTVGYSKPATLSWLGAGDGTNNPISKYEIYLSETVSGGYSYLGSTTSASYNVTSKNGAGTYYYRIKAIGTISGYDSTLSDAYASLTAYVDEPVAPETVTATPSLYESGNIAVKWKAGSGSASITYEIQYSTSADGSAWAAWTQLATVSTLSYNHAPSMARGSYIKYRVRTIVASYGQASAYTVSNNVRRNQAPASPQWVLPADNAVTQSGTPSIRVLVGAEPDGTEQYLQVAIDSGSYYNAATVPATGGAVSAMLSLAIGTHVIHLRMADTQGATSDVVSQTITYAPTSWSRTIATGVIIASQSISHQSDISELLERVNTTRAYYGLSAIDLTGTTGEWADWQMQMQELQHGLTDCFSAALRSAPVWNTVPAYPIANVINQIRTQVASV